MKTNFFKATILTLITIFTISCSKDDDEKKVETPITKATIILKKTNGDFVPGIVVYAYDQSKWQVTGDNPTFADGQASSDANGNAVFSNIEYTNSFNDLNNNQNTFRFSAHYSLNGVNKTKVTSITFTKGEQKTQNVILD
ncbi:hypothetical protein QMU91_002391 [Flavobacterium psychrophilum]|jgi:hypothetical protein|nr:hypothetical protein [Flavobacterium psychrophilum]